MKTPLLPFLISSSSSSSVSLPSSFSSSRHTNNWLVLVDTSRFCFNYRPVANVLSMHRSVKRLGIPDSQVIVVFHIKLTNFTNLS